MAKSTVSGIGTCNPKWLRSNRACLSVCTFSGEPSEDQIRAYLRGRFLRPRIEHEAVQYRQPKRARNLDHARVGQKLLQISAHARVVEHPVCRD